MNRRMILHTVGRLLQIEAALLLLPGILLCNRPADDRRGGYEQDAQAALPRQRFGVEQDANDGRGDHAAHL